MTSWKLRGEGARTFLKVENGTLKVREKFESLKWLDEGAAKIWKVGKWRAKGPATNLEVGNCAT